jgi:hypothetical protein
MESSCPGLESTCDDECPASPIDMSPTYQVQSHYSPTYSRPKSSKTSQPPISQPPCSCLNSESPLSEVILVKEISMKGLEGNGDQEDMEYDELESRFEAEYEFDCNMDAFSEGFTYAQPLSTPAPERTDSDEEVSP